MSNFFFILEHVNIFIVVIVYTYLCKKHCHLLRWVYKKNNSFISFRSWIFHSEKFTSILHVKWRRMIMGEQVGNLKFWVNIQSEWPQSLFAATKIYIFIFNLTHSFPYQLNQFIPFFPMENIFSQFIGKFLKILGNGISQSFISSLGSEA